MASDDDDPKSYKALLLVTGLFLVATFKSWQEFRYMTVGQQSEATVTKTVEQRRHGQSTGYHLYYDFFNKNTNSAAHHYTMIPVDAVDQFPVGQKITIEYYGGKYPTTRLHGTSHRPWVYMFFGSLLALAGTMAYLARLSNRQDKRRR